MSRTSDREVILAWHAAVNAGDSERVLALSTDNVEVGGPRGSGRGAELLRDWIGRAGIQLQPVRFVERDGLVVVEQSAQWKTPEGGLTEPQAAASVFRLLNGKVDSVLRYADLPTALEAVGLDPSLAS